MLWQNGYMRRSEIPEIVVQFHFRAHTEYKINPPIFFVFILLGLKVKLMLANSRCSLMVEYLPWKQMIGVRVPSARLYEDLYIYLVKLSPHGSMARALDLEPKDCGFESHCGQ